MPINPGATLTTIHARHLLRRTGFGAPLEQVAEFTGMSRGEAADTLLDFHPSGFRPSAPRDDTERAHNKWVKYMVKTRTPLQEKLVVFWHDHFATNFSTVQDAFFMAGQNQLLRRNCIGNFKDLVKAINKDAAMMRFLDTDENRKREPNENYARELQELFTLGVLDFAGNENYGQDDIVQIARAFSGWRYEDDGTPFLNDDQHDYMANYPGRGPKQIYGTVVPWGTRGQFGSPQSFASPEGETEIDQVIDIIFAHRDTDSENTVARRTTSRLLEYFAHPNVALATIDEIIADANFATPLHANQWSVQALLRSMFTHDDFYPAPGQSTHYSVKWPIDYLVGTLRQLGMRLRGADQYVNGGEYERAIVRLRNMGQELFDPPSVFGWDWETAWISSAALLSRYAFARDVSAARYGGGRTVFRPLTLVDSGLTNAGNIVDRVTSVLGVADQLSAGERQTLIDYLGGPLDLNDYDTRNEKLHGLFALVMQSPAYQVH